MYPTRINFGINPDVAKFRDLLERYPDVAAHWDFKTHKEGILTLEDDEAIYMTKTDRLLFKFFKAVWTRSSNHAFEFDFIDAAFRLEYEERKMIANYLLSPICP